ncbi:DUF4283 domain-containing protein [Citrus sinensis]|uniref:DUF4283 domain-containing protein n=2 Tax=Citrus sinensis TaxID=2711 RepID=A0ACB8IKJ3_CITSI|nr:DUF4283 domain-containing protein [Citrus sinensis]KDO38231.1 hypothetical protein CISIN_1g041269mg [Citrus sinensis]
MSYEKVSPPPLANDRFTKKTKFRAEGADGDNPTPLSYRDIAMEANGGSANVVFGMSDEWVLEEEDVCCKEDDSMPYIAFSQRVHDRLAKPWANSVVVKTLGRNLGYRVISERLKKLWGSKMGFSIIDLANDYYLVRFQNEGDVEYALTEGPWTIMGHYLFVQQWTPDFDATTNKVDRIVAWIRLSSMNIHFYHKTIIRRLGQIVGPVIKIDYLTAAAQRGKFARIAVQLDLEKPLVSQFNFEGRVQKVEYENLPMICFSCGKFGHYQDACPDGGVTPVEVESLTSCPDAANRDMVVGEVSNQNESKFRSWMVVTRKPRPRRFSERVPHKVSLQSQHGLKINESRFDVLGKVMDEETVPHNQDDTSVIHQETLEPILENPNVLAPKSRSMKKKQVSQLMRKYPTKKTSAPSNKSLAENINPNNHSRGQTSQPHSPTLAMQGMHENLKILTTPEPCATFDDPCSSMHGMHALPNTMVASPIPVPVTLNPLNHSAVSFPNPSLQLPHSRPHHEHMSEGVLAQVWGKEPPDEDGMNSPKLRGGTFGELDSAVAGRRLFLTDEDTSGVPDTFMVDDAEAIRLS